MAAARCFITKNFSDKKELTKIKGFAGVGLCPMLTSFGVVGDVLAATSPWGIIGAEAR